MALYSAQNCHVMTSSDLLLLSLCTADWNGGTPSSRLALLAPRIAVFMFCWSVP